MCFFFTIRQVFYPRRHTPWKSQSISEEGRFVLRKLSISQDSVILYFGFISPSLSITSLLVTRVVRANHLYAGANFSNIYWVF